MYFTALLAGVLLLSACSADDASSEDAADSDVADPTVVGSDETTTTAQSAGEAETSAGIDEVQPAQPVAGGELVYGLEAESPQGFNVAAWFCGPSCRMVAKSVFDPLLVVTSSGTMKPYLAESVVPNSDATEWTITARSGVLFHDGTAFDAEAIKANLEARTASPIYADAFANVESVTVVDELEVLVTMKAPWSVYDRWLAGPAGYMMAPSMMAAEDGANNPVGTGPFIFGEWVLDDRLTVEKNGSYWQEGLPYLDKVTFRPIPDGIARVASLRAGDLDVMQTDQDELIAELRGVDGVRTVESQLFGESNFYNFNSTRPPFDDIRVRRALVMATDVDQLNELRGFGVSLVANGPFPPGTLGYLENPGVPSFDPDAAAELIAEYEAEVGEVVISLMTTQSPSLLKNAQIVQEMWRTVGVDVEIEQVEFTEFISRDVTYDFDLDDGRLFGGNDPDLQYRWWIGGQVGGFTDPEIDRLVGVVRAATDPAVRKTAAEDINRRFAEQSHYLFTSWTVWVAAATDEVGTLNLSFDDGEVVGVVLGDHFLTETSLNL